MKTVAGAWLGLVCAWSGFVVPAAAAQFVELSVEVEINDWSYWFWADRENLPWSGNPESSIFGKPGGPIRCVVGTNTWMMEGPFSSSARVSYWFTGTNIIRRHQITSELPKEKLVSVAGIPAGKSPEAASVHSTITPSRDGNPGRPVRVVDVMMSPAEIFCWLAFCSSPVVRGNDPWIPFPSAFWKQYFPAGTKFTNNIAAFEDDLCLPTGITVCTDKGELALQYQAHRSTNVLGWNFPLEFYLVQYKPARLRGTNSWEVQLTAKGRVTAIGKALEPQLPEDVFREGKTRR